MKQKIIITSILGLTAGIIAACVFMTVSDFSDLQVDVTYMNERQAVVFWQSKKPGMGSVKYGKYWFWQPTHVDQTSSEPNLIHTVLLEELPLEGVYLTLHTTKQPWFTLPRIMHIQYSAEETDET